MKIPNPVLGSSMFTLSLARIVSEDSQHVARPEPRQSKSSKDS